MTLPRVDFERALAFVETHGDALARARAAALVAGAPREMAVDALGAGAAEGASPADDVDRALHVLAVLDDLRALHLPAAERVGARAMRLQRDDGAWVGRDASEDGALFATGMLGGFLAKASWSRPGALEAAGDHLSAHWSPARVKGGAWRAIAAYAHYFANAPHERADEILQWCGRELERGYRAGAFDAVVTARVLTWCDAGALPGARLAAAELATAVCAAQADDGGWPASGARPSRVANTLDALAWLARLAPRRRATAREARC